MAHTAIVAGGGIGGLAAAIGLARAGWHVDVLEQRSALAEAGAGIVLWPNGMQALDRLGVADRVARASELEVAGGFRRPDGRWLVRLDGAELTRRFGRAAALHRRDLLGILADGAHEAGVRVRTGVRVVAARPDGTIVTEDGDVRADVVIGADGIRSAVRAAFPVDPEPRPTGLTAWRWVVDRDAAGCPGDPVPCDTMGVGMELGIIPLPRRQVYCFASSARRRDGSVPQPEDYRGWHEPARALVDAGLRGGMLRHELQDLPPLPTFVTDRVALLGDAAHAMTPHLGQGACQALEDAAALGLLARRHDDPVTLLAAYDRVRRPRAQALQRASRQAMAGAATTSPLLVRARDAFMAAVPDALVPRLVGRWSDSGLPPA